MRSRPDRFLFFQKDGSPAGPLQLRCRHLPQASLYYKSHTMTTTEPRRSFFQTAVHNFFALYLGVTPPAHGQEGFYAALLLGVCLVLLGIGYLIVRLLMGMMLG